MVKEFPFKETVISDGDVQTVLRVFEEGVDEADLLWHWDDEDRIVHVLTEESDWLFQFDNQLPIPMKGKIKIPKGVWHRVIKGTGNLEIIIEKIKN